MSMQFIAVIADGVVADYARQLQRPLGYAILSGA